MNNYDFQLEKQLAKEELVKPRCRCKGCEALLTLPAGPCKQKNRKLIVCDRTGIVLEEVEMDSPPFSIPDWDPRSFLKVSAVFDIKQHNAFREAALENIV